MATKGPYLATAGTSETYSGGATWSNPGNITAEDGTNQAISGTLSVGGSTDWLCATFSGAMTLSAMAGLLVTGLLVEWKVRAHAVDTCRAAEVIIERDGVSTGCNKAVSPAGNAPYMGTTLAWQTFGGPSEVWCARWDAIDFVGTRLKVKARFTNDVSSGAVRADACRLTVHHAAAGYTPATIEEDFSGGIGVFTQTPYPGSVWDFTGGRATCTTAIGGDMANVLVAGVDNVDATYDGAKGSCVILEDYQWGSGSPGFGALMFTGGAANEKGLSIRIASNGLGARIWQWSGTAAGPDTSPTFSFAAGQATLTGVHRCWLYIYTGPNRNGPWTLVHRQYRPELAQMVGKHAIRHPHPNSGSGVGYYKAMPWAPPAADRESPLPRSLGMNVGTSGNPNNDPALPLRNLFKLSDAFQQRSWATGNTQYPPLEGQLDANGYYKYINSPTADFVYSVLWRPDEADAMRLAAPTYVLKWDGQGNVTIQGCVGGNQNSSSGRLEFTPEAGSIGEMLLGGLPVAPGDSDHFRNARLTSLAEENAETTASAAIIARVQPLTGPLRPMELLRINGTGWDPNTAQRPLESDALWSDVVKGIPIEACCKMAIDCGNKVLWLNVSHNAAGTGDAPVATFATTLMGILETTLPAGYKVILELSNESCFNDIFQSNLDFKSRGLALFNTGDVPRNGARYHTMKSIQFALACKAASTGVLDVRYVLGAFVADNQVNDELRTYKFAGLGAADVFDAYCIAPYTLSDFGQSQPGNFGLTIRDIISNVNQAAAVDAMFTEAATRIAGFTSAVEAVIAAWASMGMDVWYYEGPAMHFFYSFEPENFVEDAEMHAACQAFFDDPRMYELTRSIIGAALPLSDGPACYYTLAGHHSTGGYNAGAFGSMRYSSSSIEDDNSPIYRALLSMIAGGSGATKSGCSLGGLGIAI